MNKLLHSIDVPRTKKKSMSRATTMEDTQIPRWYDRFMDEEQLERFRKRLPRYRQEEFYQEYDVVKVQYLLHLIPRPPEIVEVYSLAKAYGFWPGQQFFYFRVDVQGAMSRCIDLTRPILGIRGLKYPLLDGLHRLYKAAHSEQLTLMCLFLTTEEARLCDGKTCEHHHDEKANTQEGIRFLLYSIQIILLLWSVRECFLLSNLVLLRGRSLFRNALRRCDTLYDGCEGMACCRNANLRSCRCPKTH